MPALSKNGNNGFHIIVPMEIEKKKLILFDTGWVPLAKKEKNKRLNNLIKEKKYLLQLSDYQEEKVIFSQIMITLKIFGFLLNRN